jgi:hypothetical protein
LVVLVIIGSRRSRFSTHSGKISGKNETEVSKINQSERDCCHGNPERRVSISKKSVKAVFEEKAFGAGSFVLDNWIRGIEAD